MQKFTTLTQPTASECADCDNFLSELIHLEGWGSISDVCGGCGTLYPHFRCEDCFGVTMYCQNCIVKGHCQHPLHHLEYWTGSYFEHRSSRDLGLQIQLGHWVGERCYRPCPAARDDFMVIHSNGIHSVSLDFCSCESAEAPFQQLLCIHWFPASSKKPCTAAMFSVLQQFHLLSFESKVSTFKFHQSLSHSSDNTGLNPPKFLHIIPQWHHLKLLKCTGRGHIRKFSLCYFGISSTKQGDCTLLCPACPHPGKNLPLDWRSVEPGKQFLYSLFRAVSKDLSDPGLSEGWAYFVEESAYKSYLSHHANDIQETDHNAINMADTKANKGLDATSVGIVVCARHGMKLVNGVGDLQKGERYANMDYLFTSALRGATIDKLNISYDITCQWHKSLYQRMMSLPQEHVSFFVPKFHLPAHVMPCQQKYSFNWMCGVGHTDGEAPEHGWAHINPIGSSTKVMGPGHHHDTIDDFFGDWNWKKTIALGSIILWKISEHQEDFEELKKSLSIKYPEQLSLWCIHLQLVKEEAQVTQSSLEPPLHPNITPSILIIDITKLGLHATDTQKAKLQQCSNTLARCIEVWTKIHVLYVPSCGKAGAPEDIPLYLPLQINHRFSCGHNLESIEFQLWEGQANDVLNELCQGLQSRAYMLKFKDCFLCGQGANTCAHNYLKNVDAKIDLSMAKYCATHHALCTLGPLLGKVGWQTALQLLVDNDIHSMSGQDNQASEACGYVVDNADDESDHGLQEAIRIEWCKVRARTHCWAEEVNLLPKEKWWTLQFLKWDAKCWAGRAEAVTGQDKLLDKGLKAYAEHQENICRRLGVSFTHTWHDMQELLAITDKVPVD
ncbi:hypothetical protein EDC04DRAFT_2871559 [Pisolithus marmoratus]|nr:hypothetical protein EDC04DRAFT_2871559 [Pisolithus marmoratus]